MFGNNALSVYEIYEADEKGRYRICMRISFRQQMQVDRKEILVMKSVRVESGHQKWTHAGATLICEHIFLDLSGQ